MDTFSLRNVDELFCSSEGRFGAAKRDNTKANILLRNRIQLWGISNLEFFKKLELLYS